MINKITINSLEIGPYSGGYLIKKLGGFESPQVDVNVKDRGKYDGARLSDYRYGRRLLSIDLEILGSSIADYEAKRQALLNALALNGLTTVKFELKSGTVLELDCIVQQKIDAPYEAGDSVYSDCQIQLVAPYPFFTSNARTVNVYRFSGGGFAIPFSIPLSMGTGGSGLETVDNAGNGIVYPTLQIFGIAENPSFANLTTGESMSFTYSLDNITDNITVDNYNRTAMFNLGTNIRQYFSGDWITLQGGENILKFTSANSTDNGYVVVSYSDSYLGV